MPIASHNPTPKAQHRSADTDKEAVLILVSNLRSCLPLLCAQAEDGVVGKTC